MKVRVMHGNSKAGTPIIGQLWGGGYPTRRRLLAAFYGAGSDYTDEELGLALRWLALPLCLREASLQHVEDRIDDGAQGGVIAGRQ